MLSAPRTMCRCVAEGRPYDQAAVVMAPLRGGADESWGEIVLLDVLAEALAS
jgi:hypothetical protein